LGAIIAMATVSPEMIGPDLVIVLETTASTVLGSVAGGFELLPRSVVHVLPHVAGGLSMKPLNEGGANPVLRGFSFHHCAPQKATWLPTARF
jgi:hypothetical protein